MSNPNKVLEYYIIQNPIGGLYKIISGNNELNNYYDTLLAEYPWLQHNLKYTLDNTIRIKVIGDLKYAKYKLFEHKIENIKSSIVYYIKWNNKPNSYHSQNYYDKYYKDLYSMEKHIEKLTKLMKQYESDNPHMLL